MEPLYPLRFRPIFRRYLWGDRRLDTVLGKPIGPEGDYAESWEVCDCGPDQSIVETGPLAGATLGELVSRRGAELLGRHFPQPRFPLLVKFLDAAQPLSVQVHPDDARAAQLVPPDSGKSEAWVVLEAEPGGVIYAGLRPGVGRDALAEAIRQGTCEQFLHRLQPRPGDCIFLPAGTVHSLGQGLLVAEIQQSGDTTFRLFDWNRVGPDGKPRTLHVEQALDSIHFEFGPVDLQKPQPTGQPGVERLVQCDKFVLDRRRLDDPQTIGGDDRCHIVLLLEGSLSVDGDPGGALHRGGTVLLPAAIGPVLLKPQLPATLLDVYLP